MADDLGRQVAPASRWPHRPASARNKPLWVSPHNQTPENEKARNQAPNGPRHRRANTQQGPQSPVPEAQSSNTDVSMVSRWATPDRSTQTGRRDGGGRECVTFIRDVMRSANTRVAPPGIPAGLASAHPDPE